jgi:hypothetical protein
MTLFMTQWTTIEPILITAYGHSAALTDNGQVTLAHRDHARYALALLQRRPYTADTVSAMIVNPDLFPWRRLQPN